MRRLPVYLLLDTSGSMAGEPIEAVNTGLRDMVVALRHDPHALETVHISIITFDITAQLLVPLTSIDALQIPEVSTPQSGPTHLGEALVLLENRLQQELIFGSATKKGDWAPLVFVMTDGKPSDLALYREMAQKLSQRSFAEIVGLLAGPKADRIELERLCHTVYALDTMDHAALSSIFKWVTTAIEGGNRSMGATSHVALPKPPPEIHVVL